MFGSRQASRAMPAKAAPASQAEFEAFRAEMRAFQRRTEEELDEINRRLSYLSNEVDEQGKVDASIWDGLGTLWGLVRSHSAELCALQAIGDPASAYKRDPLEAGTHPIESSRCFFDRSLRSAPPRRTISGGPGAGWAGPATGTWSS